MSFNSPITRCVSVMAGRLAGASATAFPKFCLAQDPSELWVAEDGHTIVGFGFSSMTEKFWYLSQLFVRCETQAKGIGRALLSKNPDENRTLQRR